MDIRNIAYDRRFGHPVVKDGCGVLGIIRKSGAPPITDRMVVEGISCIKYRGSDLGAGYAAFRTGENPDAAPYRVQAFVTGNSVAEKIARTLEEHVGPIEGESIRRVDGRRNDLSVWEANVSALGEREDSKVEGVVDAVNSSLFAETFEGRIFSYGRYLTVYKEVGNPTEVAKMWGLEGERGGSDMWLAHTRQPTNSPGSLPIWSHPFASMNTAIVHNGDISSYGSNMELLSAWGIRSHVGTDSEVIARLLDHIIRIDGLSIREAATVLTNPFERNVSERIRQLLYRYRGARLDGPFAVVAGYADGRDTYLVALTDRSKFRPLLFGEDRNFVYVASEENQIRTLSREAKIWTPEPGSFFIASLRDGIIETGTKRSLDTQSSALTPSPPPDHFAGYARLDAGGRAFREVNEAIARAHSEKRPGVVIENCSGHRYIGIGVSDHQDSTSSPFRVVVTGFPGNCLANLNDGASFEVFGNVADDLADTMHKGSVIVHGNCRDVAGQAIQGGEIFVRGTVGNRAAIQMREFLGERPFLIIGETADDYLGEYMAGGVVIVLNLSNSETPARNYIGTGMVGGRIYIRGRVSEAQFGLLPQRDDVLRYLRAQTLEGALKTEVYQEVEKMEYPSPRLLAKLLPEGIMLRVMTIFFTTKYTKPLAAESRRLNEQDLSVIGDKLTKFFRVFSLPDESLREVLQSEFTILTTREEKVELPVPPQETPIEE